MLPGSPDSVQTVLPRRAIRLCKQRWDGAINAVAERRKRLAGRRPWSPIVLLDRGRRLFSLVSGLPLYVPSRARVYFDHIGPPVGKFGIAQSELLAAGLCRSRIHVGNGRRAGVWRLLRLLVRLPRAAITLLGLRWQHKRWPRLETLTVLLGLDVARRFLRRHPGLQPLIISDMSPQLIVLASADGARAIWWQDDYHHLPEPLVFTDAVVLTAGAAEQFRQMVPAGGCYRRSGQRPVPLPTVHPPRYVGVAVNGFFNASDEQLQILDGLRRLLGVTQLQLRLHPAASLTAAVLPEWLAAAAPDEPLEEFAQRVELVVCGDSAVQLRLLALGRPVVHVAGLDTYGGYDFYGYVRDGIVCGCPQPGPGLLERVRDFYAQPGLIDRLQARMSGPVTALPPLSELAERLNGDPDHA